MTEVSTQPEKIKLVKQPFSEQDPLFDTVQARFESQPAKIDEIRSLLSTNLASVRDQVIAVRSEDILTIFHRLLEDRIPVDIKGEGIRVKERGWYYLTPIETNPFWDAIAGFEFQAVKEGDFYGETLENIGLYAHSGALATALSRNVFEHLQEGYKKELRKLFTKTYGDLFLETLFVEVLANELIDEWKLEGEERLDAAGIIRSPRRFPVFNRLLAFVGEEEDSPRIGNFLIRVIKDRGGVIVGFTKEVIQGELAFKQSEHRAIHGSKEIAVKPRGGFIDLSKRPIIAIEPLGEYEDQILGQLNLLKKI